MYEVIRFNYLFRNSENYKKFGSKLFSNPNGLTWGEITQKIRKNLISKEFFFPDKVGIEKFKFHRYWDDYSWYEFESIEILTNATNRMKELESIDDFLLKLKNGKF